MFVRRRRADIRHYLGADTKLPEREEKEEKTSDEKHEKGLFHGLKLAFADIFIGVLKQIKGHTFKTEITNPYKHPDLQKVEDTVSANKVSEVVTAVGDNSREELLEYLATCREYKRVLEDLIDRILYRLAGMTDDEAAGVEKRLKEML